MCLSYIIVPGPTGAMSPNNKPPPVLRSLSTRVDRQTTREWQGGARAEEEAAAALQRELHLGSGPGVQRDVSAERASAAAEASKRSRVRKTVAQRLADGEELDAFEACKHKTQKFMLGVPFTVFMLLLTLWALFGTDIQAMVAPKSADGTYEIVSILLFVIFMLELIVNAVTQEKYFGSFFFWLDLVAAVSMLLDVELVRDELFGDEEQDLTVARAGRAARAGTRAGRLLKMTRLLRSLSLSASACPPACPDLSV